MIYDQIQSSDEVAFDTEPSTNKELQENINFVDSNLGETVEWGANIPEIISHAGEGALSLGDYLNRPVLIKTYTWLETDTVGTQTKFNPWKLYFNNTAIKYKLNNFAFVNCKLKIKVVINASPFYYGALQLNYFPLSGLVTSSIKTDGTLSERIPLSQRPHIFIYPQLSQGGELTLPFFYHKNWLDATSATDLENMGELNFVPYTLLQSANGAVGTGVTVQVYAWAEDLKVMGPTISLAVQSQDEYGKGPISKPASAIAHFTGSLSKVPVIGKFMTATSLVAGAAGRVAHLFGYTNVPNIKDVDPYKPSAFPALASTEISTPVDKLTIDPKNELSIDSEIVGLPTSDELDLKTLVTKESFLVASSMSTTDPAETQLFNALVRPCMGSSNVVDTYPTYQNIPVSYLQYLFKYWRGDIIFRFKFICTKFHKGRVRVTFDPRGDISTSSDSHTTAFNQIIDLGEDTDFEIRVPYMQATAFLKTRTSLDDAVLSWTVGNPLTHDGDYDNGIISLRVLTPLTAPIASSSIYFMVFVRAADNFEFALPTEPPQETSVFAIQSQDEAICSYIAGKTTHDTHPAQFLANMGESIKSLRTILRRSTYVTTLQIPATTTATFSRYKHTFSRFPSYYGWDTNGVNTAVKQVGAGNTTFNFTKNTFYNWIAPMYLAQRGSMIHHFNVDTTNTDSPLSTIYVDRAGANNSSAWSFVTNFTPTTASGTSRSFTVVNGTGCSGLSLTNQITQSGLSVLLPDYNNFRFRIVNPPTNNYGTSLDNSFDDNYALSAILKPAVSTKAVANILVHKYVSIGTDFSLYHYLNVPSLVKSPLPTAA